MTSFQTSQTSLLQNAATTNGNGIPAYVGGFDWAMIEVVESAGGTCTLTLQGSFDGSAWYALGYQQVDNTATPARAVAALSVTANFAHVYQVLDSYPQVRAVISAIAAATVTVKLVAVPT